MVYLALALPPSYGHGEPHALVFAGASISSTRTASWSTSAWPCLPLLCHVAILPSGRLRDAFLEALVKAAVPAPPLSRSIPPDDDGTLTNVHEDHAETHAIVQT